jgi:hypothetical protein
MDTSLEISNTEENKLINFKSQDVSLWTIEHERILIEWADKAMCYRWLHSKANSLYAKQNAWYTIPCIIISTLAGTANFAQERVPVQYQSLFTMVVGGVNILGGIISTIQQFLKITQLNEAHRVSSIAWDKFYRNIKIEITKHPNERIHVSHMLKMCKEEFDRLMETSPVIPDQIIDNFKISFKNSVEFDKISKPEICDSLLSTDTFRNQWFSQENKDKYELDIIKLQNSIENKKKMENENNINSVKDFIKTFYHLNHRDPIETEIISNLQEKIQPSIIKKILEDLKNDESFKKNGDVNDLSNIV